MSLQHSHESTDFQKKTFPIVVVCDGLESPANVGALFRLCDALGIQEIIFCNASFNINSNRLKRTSRNTHTEVPYSFETDILSALKTLQKKEYQLIALEITKSSTPIHSLSVENKKRALIIGNEQNGVSEAVLDLINTHIHIEMYGNNSSMNVIQAAAIALHSLTKL